MLNFNTSIKDVIATQETTSRVSAFTEYNSKRKLLALDFLNVEQKQYIEQLKGTFTFHLHNAKRYLIITMYYSATKKYGFLVLDLQTLQCAEADSIKNAKKGVLDIVNSDANTENAPVVEQTEKPASAKKQAK